MSPKLVFFLIDYIEKFPIRTDKKLQQIVVLVCLMGKMKKKEKTMTRSKVLGWIILVLVAFVFLSGGPRLFASETIADYQQ